MRSIFTYSVAHHADTLSIFVPAAGIHGSYHFETGMSMVDEFVRVLDELVMIEEQESERNISRRPVAVATEQLGHGTAGVFSMDVP
ncbi:MAG: hypothetical protein OEQ39_07120 [Gammaproteobacteria bacterium]|nr:hypothetical protein [Gammaproteobacteria bacterium]MDH3466793.1 hypothetical protein [Gammaproteobacteria bacterium]